MKRFSILFAIAALIAAALSCNLPSAATPQQQSSPQASPNTAAAPTTSSASTSTPAPIQTPVITHLMTPAEVNPTGALNYDVNSSGTAPQHRAPYGNSYNLNLFERPFTKMGMIYIPALDIKTFQITSDGTWYYVFMGLIGDNPNNPINIDYGVEIDKGRDGYGDVLVWAQPPYGTQWTTNGVKVYTRPDIGSVPPAGSVANATTGASNPTDGYETVMFNQGQGDDPDLAWIRIDPDNSYMVEFAFKNSLAGSAFMWGVWADVGLKSPNLFNYNERFTNAQAGSPIASSQYYPINAIYAVDNTCQAAYGFNPTGDEPLLCQPNPQTASTPTQPAPTQPAPTQAAPAPTLTLCQKNPNLCKIIINTPVPTLTVCQKFPALCHPIIIKPVITP